MQLARFLLAAELMAITASLNALAQDALMIANRSVITDSISREELRSVFLLRARMLKDGSPVEPVLMKDGPTHAAFLKRFLDRDSAEIHIYYQGLVSTGKASMPKHFNSDAEVVAYVAHSKGAIGNVSSRANIEGVKVLTVAAENSRHERALLTRVEPEYPETLRRLGIGGNVRLQLIITPKGTVETVNILGGNPILAEAAVKSVKQWVFAAWPSRTTTEVSIPFDNQR